MGIRKLTYEEVKEYIESNSAAKLITQKQDYIDTHHEIILLCECGNEFITDFHRVKSKDKFYCNECGFKISAEKQRMNAQVVYDLFVKNDMQPMFKLEEYKNAKQRLPYVCNHHEELGVKYITYDNLKQGKRCPQCNIDTNRAKAKKNYQKMFEDREYIFVDTKYRNKKTYVEYICPKHKDKGVQIIMLSNFSKGQGCGYCAKEYTAGLKRNDIDVVKSVFVARGYIYMETNVYENNLSELKYICEKHSHLGEQTTNYANIRRAITCKLCNYEQISGENHYLWKGGISPLHNYLRYKINDWKRQSLKEYNYKCAITGSDTPNLVVHHLYSFADILSETLEELKYPIYSEVGEYSDDMLNNIEKAFIQKHEYYGYGIPLLDVVHDKFHEIYLRGSNTPEQFKEFKTRLKEGEFNDFLEENKLKLTI